MSHPQFLFFCMYIFSLVWIGPLPASAQTDPSSAWKHEWPKTDFSQRSIDLTDIISGGPTKDGIPAIDAPQFVSITQVLSQDAHTPVISVKVGQDARAYPLSILMFHEIVNDTVGGQPVAITYCPLCNAAIVYQRTVQGQVLDFGTTGKLRLSDMVMYDRQTQSWWQQFTGTGIVGLHNGTQLKQVPARIESLALFIQHHPQGKLLMPHAPSSRPYGRNPYVYYDSATKPFLYRGDYKGSIPALARVVAVGHDAWPLDILRQKSPLVHNDLIITWQSGQNSALDNPDINEGRDVGNVVVQQRTPGGQWLDVAYHIPFAFAFMAFNPQGTIHTP